MSATFFYPERIHEAIKRSRPYRSDIGVSKAVGKFGSQSTTPDCRRRKKGSGNGQINLYNVSSVPRVPSGVPSGFLRPSSTSAVHPSGPIRPGRVRISRRTSRRPHPCRARSYCSSTIARRTHGTKIVSWLPGCSAVMPFNVRSSYFRFTPQSARAVAAIGGYRGAVPIQTHGHSKA